MDTKNVIAAISLSAAVIILYSLFFAPSPNELKKIDEEKSSLNSEAPKLDSTEKIIELSRDQALKESKRVEFENQNIKGSISLLGGTIDDLFFKNYTETLEGKNKITLLNPKKYGEGYFVETGWVSSSKNIDLPNSNTIWKIEGNNKLTPREPITLVWDNNQGISFKKKIKIDEKFLFSIDQIITNKSKKSYDFYSYGQIIRNKSPEVTNFYILHEGLIGVFDDQLVEKDYDDIEEKEFSQNASSGWLGITDKYWIASLIPEKNKEFKADFEFKNKSLREIVLGSDGSDGSFQSIGQIQMVNVHLWNGALETVIDYPIKNLDSSGGYIETEWITQANNPSQRCIIKINITSRELVSNGVNSKIICQNKINSEWLNDELSYDNEAKQLTITILNKASKSYQNSINR